MVRVRRLAKSCSLTTKGTFSVTQITQMGQITQICEIKNNQRNHACEKQDAQRNRNRSFHNTLSSFMAGKAYLMFRRVTFL